MYDLHTHILPGVDDGPETIDESIEMARVAARDRTRVMLATPHRRDVTENWSVPHIRGLVEDLNGRIRSEGIDLTIRLGMENHIDTDVPGEVSAGRALRINETRYILVELPFFGRPNYIEDVLFRLQIEGLTPVLAHPERIEAFQRDAQMLAEFVDRGMISQITAGSIVGRFGRGVERFTRTLLKRGLVHVISSDAHEPVGPRSPGTSVGVGEAARFVGNDKAQAMVVDTPKAILDDRPVEVEPAVVLRRPRRWWRPWGGD